MDEQYQQMQRFLKELEGFNVALTESLQELRVKHDAVSPLWQDQFRRQYDAQYAQFIENMERYCYREAQKYENFLSSKMTSLRNYLGG